MNSTQSVICAILREKSASPISKLLAVQKFFKLAKDSVETFHDEFISQVQKTILPILEKQGQFYLENKDQNRGKFIFTDKPNQDVGLGQIGNSFLRLILECIFVWSKWFPIDPDTNILSHFKVTYEKLIRIGVQFPKLIYFKPKNVMKSLPEVSVPIGMLKQCDTVIRKDLLINEKPSHTKFLVAQLDCSLRSQLNLTNGDIFYSDKIERCIKQIVKPQRKQSVYAKSPKSEQTLIPKLAISTQTAKTNNFIQVQKDPDIIQSKKYADQNSTKRKESNYNTSQWQSVQKSQPRNTHENSNYSNTNPTDQEKINEELIQTNQELKKKMRAYEQTISDLQIELKILKQFQEEQSKIQQSLPSPLKQQQPLMRSIQNQTELAEMKLQQYQGSKSANRYIPQMKERDSDPITTLFQPSFYDYGKYDKGEALRKQSYQQPQPNQYQNSTTQLWSEYPLTNGNNRSYTPQRVQASIQQRTQGESFIPKQITDSYTPKRTQYQELKKDISQSFINKQSNMFNISNTANNYLRETEKYKV